MVLHKRVSSSIDINPLALNNDSRLATNFFIGNAPAKNFRQSWKTSWSCAPFDQWWTPIDASVSKSFHRLRVTFYKPIQRINTRRGFKLCSLESVRRFKTTADTRRTWAQAHQATITAHRQWRRQLTNRRRRKSTGVKCCWFLETCAALTVAIQTRSGHRSISELLCALLAPEFIGRLAFTTRKFAHWRWTCGNRKYCA